MNVIMRCKKELHGERIFSKKQKSLPDFSGRLFREYSFNIELLFTIHYDIHEIFVIFTYLFCKIIIESCLVIC